MLADWSEIEAYLVKPLEKAEGYDKMKKLSKQVQDNDLKSEFDKLK